MDTQTSMRFRFWWLDAAGDADGEWPNWGRLQACSLWLADAEVPVAAILAVQRRGKNLTLVFAGRRPSNHLRLRLTTMAMARRLQRALAVCAGEREMSGMPLNPDRRLQASNRKETCGNCGMTIVLISQPWTPQVHCHFCDALTELDRTMRHSIPSTFSVCPECHYFSDTRLVKFFTFYFLFVDSGVRLRQRHACSRCLTPQAVRNLLLNLPFLLGVPLALWQVSRIAWTRLVGQSAQLHAAAGAASAMATEIAVRRHQLLLQEVSAHAGVRRNLAFTLAQAGDRDGAVTEYLACLVDCCNYKPALEELATLRQTSGSEATAIARDSSVESPPPDANSALKKSDQRAVAGAATGAVSERHSSGLRRVLGLYSAMLIRCNAIPVLGWSLLILGYAWGGPLVWLHVMFPPRARASLRNRIAGTAYFLILLGLEMAAWLVAQWPGGTSYPDHGPVVSRMLLTYIIWNLVSGGFLLIAILVIPSSLAEQKRERILEEVRGITLPPLSS